MSTRYCYITGERRDDGRYLILRVAAGEKPEPAMVVDTEDEANEQVALFNNMLGLTKADVAAILAA